MAARITAILEQKQPIASRLVRLHQYYWLRMWLESGAMGKAGSLPATSEDVMDHVFTVGSYRRNSGDCSKKRGPIGPPFSCAIKLYYLGMKARCRDVSGAAGAMGSEPESWAGPRPSLMMARESGISLVCQPLSLWNFCMAASVCSVPMA